MARRFDIDFSGDDPKLKSLVELALKNSPNVFFNEKGLLLDKIDFTQFEGAIENSLQIFVESTLKEIPFSFLNETLNLEKEQENSLLFTKTILNLRSADFPILNEFQTQVLSLLNNLSKLHEDLKKSDPNLALRLDKLLSLGQKLKKMIVFFETTFERSLLFPGQWGSCLKLLDARVRDNKVVSLRKRLRHLLTAFHELQIERRLLIQKILWGYEKFDRHELKSLDALLQSFQENYELFLGKETVFFQTFSVCSSDGKKVFLVSNLFKVFLDTLGKLMYKGFVSNHVSISSLVEETEKVKTLLSRLEDEIESVFQKKILTIHNWTKIYREILFQNPLLLLLSLGVVGIVSDLSKKKMVFCNGAHFFLSDWLNQMSSQETDLEKLRSKFVQNNLKIDEDEAWIEALKD
jgi:hypothetical protein